MGDYFVLLADGTPCNKIGDEDREARPPEIPLEDGFGAKTSQVAQEGRIMDGI